MSTHPYGAYGLVDPGGAPQGRVRDLFPLAAATRGPLVFRQPSPAERAASDAMAAFIHRHVGDIITAQDAALDAACALALEHGWDVHVVRNPPSRFIGLELAPRDRNTRIPTIHEHPARAGYGDYDRWEDDE